MKRSPRLERYRRFVGNELLDQIYNAAASLAGLHILHINTTAQGGGVAELLHALMPVMDELGIKHTRKVVPLDDSSSRFEAHLVDLLQGIKHGDVAEEDQADLYFIHDFQLVPLATLFPWMKPALWMCHVDTANPDPNGKAYIEQFLDAYNVCVFDTPLSVFKTLPAEKIIAFYNETLNGFWAGE